MIDDTSTSIVDLRKKCQKFRAAGRRQNQGLEFPPQSEQETTYQHLGGSNGSSIRAAYVSPRSNSIPISVYGTMDFLNNNPVAFFLSSSSLHVGTAVHHPPRRRNIILITPFRWGYSWIKVGTKWVRMWWWDLQVDHSIHSYVVYFVRRDKDKQECQEESGSQCNTS